jgi:recombination protein RecA
MSSAVVSTSAALGRPFVFEDEADGEMRSLPGTRQVPEEALVGTAALSRPVEGSSTIWEALQSTIKNQQSRIPPARVTSASRLEVRPAPEMVSSGIPALDSLTGGLPRGCLTEICGPASSGRTTVLLAALAAATRRGEFCAVVDASDALDPLSAAAAGVELDRLLWVRCGEEAPKLRSRQKGCPISRASLAREVGVSPQDTFDFNRIVFKENELKGNGSRQSEHRMEQVLRATDLLLESGGFGLIALDLGDLPPQSARRIPLTTWFRFRRAVEYTPTILLALEPHSIAGSCSTLLLQLGSLERPVQLVNRQSADLQNSDMQISDTAGPSHAQLLTGLEITAELIRSRVDRKPASSVAFATKTAWAG